jgi:hypothetical protein
MDEQNITAFPIVNPNPLNGLYQGYGLSKRELFAAMAMQGILSSGNQEEGWIGVTVVMQSISLADELIKQLNFTGE